MQFVYHSDNNIPHLFIETFDELVYGFFCKVTFYITMLIMLLFFTVHYTKNTMVITNIWTENAHITYI